MGIALRDEQNLAPGLAIVEVLVGGSKVAQLEAGSPFGETALIKEENRNASVRAITYCDVYKLSKADFDALRLRHADFDAQVRKVVEERLKDSGEKRNGK